MTQLLRGRRGKLAAAVAVAIAAAGGMLALSATGPGEGEAVETFLVDRAEFRLSHFEAGEIRARKDEKVLAPEVRGRLKITYLWPEGEKVEIGDLILAFDRSELEAEVKNEAGELEKALADRRKGLANQKQILAGLAVEVEKVDAALELARINLQRSEYASPIVREERKIELAKAERAIAETRENLDARRIVNRVERANLDLRVSHHEKRYDKARKDFDRLTVYARRPGIVVYETIRKRGTSRRGKVTEGDVVWGGTSLLSLPDLRAMQVVSQIGEMDVTRVKPGQKALIRLEAFPGPVFHGEVAAVAPMAGEVEDAPNVHVFEMAVVVEEQDDRLYPGMSAAVEIILQSIPDAVRVPLSAIRREEGRAVVWRSEAGGFTPVEVAVGPHSGTEIVIEAGLEAGDVVALDASSVPLPP